MTDHDIRLIEIGQKEDYDRAVKEIVAWVADHDFGDYHINSASLDIADEIESKFGGSNAS